MILLKDEEIREVIAPLYYDKIAPPRKIQGETTYAFKLADVVLKAQSRRVADWLEKKKDSPQGVYEVFLVDRKEWQELKKEAGL